MNHLNWELHTLSRAVVYKNLSSASMNIGLSQPQLSRIVAKLEKELKVVLLDRSSKRSSSWTPVAHRIAEVYSRSVKVFERDLSSVSSQAYARQLCIGSLEGLVPIALSLCQHLFKGTDVEKISLDVHDLNRLEELFYKGEHDLILVSREPVARKPRFSWVLGYQTLELRKTGSQVRVLSSYEEQSGAEKNTDGKKTLVSNSLLVRERWVEKFGGSASIPSPVSATQSDHGVALPVILLGTDIFSPLLWEKIRKLKLV